MTSISLEHVHFLLSLDSMEVNALRKSVEAAPGLFTLPSGDFSLLLDKILEHMDRRLNDAESLLKGWRSELGVSAAPPPPPAPDNPFGSYLDGPINEPEIAIKPDAVLPTPLTADEEADLIARENPTPASPPPVPGLSIRGCGCGRRFWAKNPTHGRTPSGCMACMTVQGKILRVNSIKHLIVMDRARKVELAR